MFLPGQAKTNLEICMAFDSKGGTCGNWPPFSAGENFLSSLVGTLPVFQMVGFEFRQRAATCGNVLPLTSDPPYPPFSLPPRPQMRRTLVLH